ncbi:DUF952 domain-containing protein [Nocardioides sp. MH1]|uniref:DUF952 domain-containing protein n=1 Tax=Nocardioides sp. MH1 TaxID=3242490 RepID=UPI0035229C52
MATIFHLALESDWAAAQKAGDYRISTLGRTLAEEGFIHASRGDQWPGVRDRFYGGVTEQLLLLQIDTDLVGVPIVEEPPVPGATETFPHIYGPLPVTAVAKVIPLEPALSTAAPAPTPTPGGAPAEESAGPEGSFGRFFLWEMIRNMTLVILIMVAVALGYALSTPFGDRIAPLVGIVVGFLVGLALARAIYVRRRSD